MRKKDTVESISLTTLNAGTSFYTHKKDKNITAIASYYKKKIKTERILVVNPQTTTIEKITKVTIL
jgi:hypothetical protein